MGMAGPKRERPTVHVTPGTNGTNSRGRGAGYRVIGSSCSCNAARSCAKCQQRGPQSPGKLDKPGRENPDGGGKSLNASSRYL